MKDNLGKKAMALAKAVRLVDLLDSSRVAEAAPAEIGEAVDDLRAALVAAGWHTAIESPRYAPPGRKGARP